MSGIFDDIVEGAISFDSGEVFTEAVTADNLEYLKMLKRPVYMNTNTVGKGSLCYLYTHNQNESIDLIKNRSNFIDRTHKFRMYYYNILYLGKLYNKHYRFKDVDLRKEYYEKIKSDKELNLIPRIRFNVDSNDNRNLYYELFRYIEIFNNICEKLPIQKYVEIYWTYFNSIYTTEIPGYTNKCVLVDLKLFSLNKKIKDNLKNPLFNIYYTLLRYPELFKKINVNIDFLFFNESRVMKINPSQLSKDDIKKLKPEMRKIMSGITPESTIDDATDDSSIAKDEIVSDAVSNVVMKVLPDQEEDIIITNTEDLHKMSKVTGIEQHVEKKAKIEVNDLPDDIIDTETDNSEISDVVDSSIKKELDSDTELINRIYYDNKRKQIQSKSSLSSARDEMLRNEQKNIKVGNMTISDIEKINAENVKIPITDVSNSVKTTNENLKQIRFDNLEKTYIEKVMKKDIVNSILCLNDKSIPMFVRGITVEDTSDELNYKDTYTVQLEDANRKRHTLKVDIPKFVDDKFLYIGGNKKMIKHQNFFYPVVKLSPDMVQIVSNYSKMTIQRVDSKSISSVERLFKFVGSKEDVRKYFKIGYSVASNRDYITTLEYDDLSKSYSSFECGNTKIFFDQIIAHEYMKAHSINDKEKSLFVGVENNKPIYINIDTQTNESGDHIVDIIVRSLPKELSDEFNSVKAPKRLMYAKVKLMAQFVNVGMLLGFWTGISKLLEALKCEYRVEDKAHDIQPNEDFIAFSDCVLIYKSTVPISLILNGIRMTNTERFSLADFDDKHPYLTYIESVYGKAIIENSLMNFYEFMIDPITKEILDSLNYPTNLVDLIIYAISLLSDSQFENDISQNLSRVRCAEIIPAILYDKISKNYVTYRNFAGRKKFSIPQDCVIKEILAQKTVEDYSTLNPFLEMDMSHSISSKGFRGVNLDDSYTIEKRGYDPSMIGIISPSTSPDGNCGVAKTLTLEPNITNIRGFTEDFHKENKLNDLKDANVFSPGELAIPLGATIDDPTRLGHAQKQSRHVIPVKDSSPVLISNGMEEVARFHLSSDFVINAAENGEIVDYNPETNIMIAKYKSGKCQAIDLNPSIVKNSGGGFFLSNSLITDLKVGSKFKANDILAYHKDFFKNDEFNSCRLVMGTLTKVAIMSSYNTYEDSTFITQKLSERCSTEMCFLKSAVVGKNSNIFYIAKKGQEISVGDPLIQFDTSYEDDTINTLLASLSQSEKDTIMEGARNEIKSKYSGVIEDIKIYSTVDLAEMNPSLRKIVSNYYSNINMKKEFLDKYDPNSSSSIIKCGTLVTETTKKIQPNQFGVIKGEHVEESVLFEFYIKHSEPLEVGSKVANFTALKNTVGEILPEGYEPFSSYRPDEEVSTFIASNSILNRMTPSILLTALGNKCIIELKRHLKELNFDRQKMESLIYRFFDAIDKSKKNTKKYKELFEPMTDAQFTNYFKKLFSNDYAYLVLDIVDYEHSVNLTDIENGAKVLNVPLYEYVSVPHLTMDKNNVIVSKNPVPVGYINLKRTQQTLRDRIS